MINKRQGLNRKYRCNILVVDFNQVISILFLTSFSKIG